MRVRLAVIAVAALAAVASFAAIARADGGSSTPASASCSVSFSAGSLTTTCTTPDGASYACTATFSWTSGFGLTCTGPNGGKLVCSANRYGGTCTATLPDGTTKTYSWKR